MAAATESSSSLSSLSSSDLKPITLDASFFGLSADSPLFSGGGHSSIAPFQSFPFTAPATSPPKESPVELQNKQKQPSKPKKKAGFACFCLAAEEPEVANDDTHSSLSPDSMDVIPETPYRIPNFQALIEPCRINGTISLEHLHTLQPALCDHFYSFLAKEHSEENLDAWLALDSILHISILSDIKAAIQELYNDCFADSAEHKIGCSEIYPLMESLLATAEKDPGSDEVWSPVESMHSTICLIKVRLENSSESSLVVSLHRWENLCLQASS
ncbi:MAG: regulator of G-protein signaling domain-containing protein [archaeon]|nr:regulator of G-protein signaling domain-containing protein [archaeon]